MPAGYGCFGDNVRDTPVLARIICKNPRGDVRKCSYARKYDENPREATGRSNCRISHGTENIVGGYPREGVGAKPDELAGHGTGNAS
jgi:hypothetical protein